MIDTLDNLPLGESATVIANNVKGENKKLLINLGLSNKNRISSLYKSPLGDPVAYMIKNVIIAIRKEDSKNIIIMRDKNGIN